ncbi:MAG: 4-alpha-glucanotransferase [Prolixibacteraceae bacterium]|nr:4-alpha-glucanotransferase [Prolixibacteraceae bacterium]
MKLTFRINYKTAWGQSLWISGSTSEIGNWDTREAFPMLYIGNGEWETTFSTEEEEFEYKYFIKNADKSLLWEGGKNRCFASTGHKIVEIRDFWRPKADEDFPLFSKVFTGVLMAHTKNSTTKKMAGNHSVIRFNLSAPRVPKHLQVSLVGNIPSLGNWIKPVTMKKTGSTLWSLEVDLGKAKFPMGYKYVLTNRKTKETEVWEEGNERSIFFVNKTETPSIHIRNDEKFRYPAGNWKGAGVAVPVFSLRSRQSFGTGEFNDLKKLADWASKTGLKMIQVLPINETVATHSWLDSYPYKAISVYALHPIYLNLQQMGKLKNEKLNDEFEVARELLNSKSYVDYIEVTRVKSRYYKLIFDQEWDNIKDTKPYRDFFDENNEWLEPYAAFCFLRDRFKTSNFREWGEWAQYNPKKIKKLTDPKTEHYEHIAVHYFIQYHLDKQLSDAIEYGHKKGVAFKGDIPIGISPNSIEAWTQPELFNLNGQAGAPPDDFAVLGQNWGFPTYNWDVMEKDGFAWWRNRLDNLSKYFDAYRIDHILGFFRIWEIPKHAIHGLLGYFKPGLPLSLNEIQDRGIWFDYDRFLKPYIRGHFLHEIFGEYASEVKKNYLIETENNQFGLKEEFNTQQKVYQHFTTIKNTEKNASEKDITIRDGLIALIDEVLLIKDPYSAHLAFHPRISMHYSYSYRELDSHTKSMMNDLYIDFFYKRHESFWKDEAYRKLPTLIHASNMLVCGEDLGMVPDCVPEVMENLNILSLEIQRMPKNPDIEFGHPADAPYLSVCTTSTHDMSTIRGWWEENHERTKRFYRTVLGHNNTPPPFAEPWVCKEIINQHLYSPALFTIFPIQDLLAMDGDLRWDETDKERINVPSDEKNKWRYRMILSLEELLKAKDFNRMLSEMVKRAGRNSEY